MRLCLFYFPQSFYIKYLIFAESLVWEILMNIVSAGPIKVKAQLFSVGITKFLWKLMGEYRRLFWRYISERYV